MNTGDYRLVFQTTPIFPMGEWWQYALGLSVLVFLLGLFLLIGRRESRTNKSGWIAVFFRVLPLVVLIAFCVNPQRLSERRSVQHSEVAVLLDTSLSMTLKDQTTSESTSEPSRYDRVIRQLRRSELLQQLSKSHRVSLFTFDESPTPELLATIEPQLSELADSGEWLNSEQRYDRHARQQWQRVRPWILTGLIVGGFGVLMTLTGLLILVSGIRARRSEKSWLSRSGRPLFSIGMISLSLGLGGVGIGDLLETGWTLPTKIGNMGQVSPPELSPWEVERSGETQESLDTPAAEAEMLWTRLETEVLPTGTETRIGDSLKSVAQTFAARSLAGLVIVTDGNQNIGSSSETAAASFGQNGIPIQVVGVGRLEPAKNAMVVSVDAPAKVLPEMPFTIRGYYRTQNLEGLPCRLELGILDQETDEVKEILDSRNVTGRSDDAAQPFEFSLQAAAAGRTRYQVKIISPEGDFSPTDDAQSVEVAVVDRRNRVLLLAGGPSREFRFLRNQLYRDPMVESDVWLQSMDQGADQEAERVLDAFPANEEELDQYDCVIAFDPDWSRLDAQQARDLENWVSQRGGGLISVAGPVFTPEWSASPRGTGVIDPIRRLYPVSFFSQTSAQSKVGRFGGQQAFPLDFTREGTSVDFLALTNDPLTSREAWNQFEGVFGYYAVNEAKPGAQVLAYFSDPATMMGQQKPIYLASQFVGKGRVFFQASGEMWRIRRSQVSFFQTYYTKLIRWASQGRLLRDSQQGNLIVDRQRCWVGDQVKLQAQLQDAQGRPLGWPEVNLMVRPPAGEGRQVTLAADPENPGDYEADLLMDEEGAWRFYLTIPEATDGATLQQSVQVQMSDLEKRESQRNVELLQNLADKSDGQYFDLAELDPATVGRQLVDTLDVRQLETIEPGQLDQRFQQQWLRWLFGWFVAYFCLGWIYRRMNHLA